MNWMKWEEGGGQEDTAIKEMLEPTKKKIKHDMDKDQNIDKEIMKDVN